MTIREKILLDAFQYVEDILAMMAINDKNEDADEIEHLAKYVRRVREEASNEHLNDDDFSKVIKFMQRPAND